MREGKRPGWENGLYALMRERLSIDEGRELYAQRKKTVEPVYGQIKYNRRIDRFMRRGRAAAQSEWRLAAATHNLLKLHSHRIANTTRHSPEPVTKHDSAESFSEPGSALFPNFPTASQWLSRKALASGPGGCSACWSLLLGPFCVVL